MILKRIASLIVALCFAGSVRAQTWEIGGFAGTAGYMGDLNPVNPFKLSDFAYGGLLKYNIDGYWAIKFNVQRGQIEARDEDSDNADHRLRNLSFFSPVTELSLQTEFNFFNYIPSMSKKVYTPYLFAGIGMVAFNPQTEMAGKIYELSFYGTEGQAPNSPYKKMVMTMPIGAGIKYNFGGKWNLGAELGYRTAYTDYLDDVSQRYVPDKLLVPNDPDFTALRRQLADRSVEVGGMAHASGTQRGDYRQKDTYLFMGITLSYTFFTSKCPVVDQ